MNIDKLRGLEDYFSVTMLLPDESLGGILREYNEVKRKARVGERIKSTTDDRGFGGFKQGDIFVVTDISGQGGDNYGADFTDNRGEKRAFWTTEKYVVLEPSDIIRIDSERLHMVERKAAVGERVVITNWKASDHADPNAHKNGETPIITEVAAFVSIDGGKYCGFSALAEDEYRVLEPLTDAIPTQISSRDFVDQYAENIAVLAMKMATLEKRVATLESASKPLDINMPEVARKLADILKYSETKKTPQQIRDEIVARAKADVERLKNHGGDYNVANGARSPFICNATFSVNRNKRKVTVVLRGANSGKTRAVGRAICVPGEVFNVHIGRAIALHRALGLEVPAEYMNVPSPTEVRVGDIVTTRLFGNTRVVRNIYRDELWFTTGTWLYRDDVTIADDSRMSAEESEGVNA